MKRAAIASIAVAAALCTDPAQADGCPPSGTDWLRVAFAGDAFTPALHDRVVDQLGADLRVQRFALCEMSIAASTAATPPPLADIALSLSAEAVLSLEVRDAVTGKRIARDLPLGTVPRDALAFSIALAAEELLHASWIEASLRPQVPPAIATELHPVGLHPVPSAVLDVNAGEVARMQRATTAPAASPGGPSASGPSTSGPSASGPSASGPFTSAALMAAGERSTGGQTDLGGDLRLAWGARLAATARAGFRLAPDVSSTHGTVRGRELLAGLGASYAMVPRIAAWGGDLGVRADVVDVEFSAIASPGAHSASGSSLGVLLSGVVGGWIRMEGRWRVVADVAVGAPLRAVAASDAGEVTTGVSGVTLGFALGIAGAWPD
jgi:hypothetical protein